MVSDAQIQHYACMADTISDAGKGVTLSGMLVLISVTSSEVHVTTSMLC
jgi:hypothetical protein